MVTSNQHKALEMERIARIRGAPIKLHVKSLPHYEIQADTLEEIAIHSAQHAWEKIRCPLITEDSGLFIDALKGFPGPFSSYVYKTISNKGILRLMEGVRDRSATFRSVIAYVNNKQLKVFKGHVHGRISEKEAGKEGFGFDPIFIPENSEKTFSQMGEEKNRLSHRAKAFNSLLDWFIKEYSDKRGERRGENG